MAEIVSVIALAHAPGATGWLDKAPAFDPARDQPLMQEIAEQLAARNLVIK